MNQVIAIFIVAMILIAVIALTLGGGMAPKTEAQEQVVETREIAIREVKPMQVYYFPPAKEKPAEGGKNLGNPKATITHYCACSKCNGKYSRTEDGINYTATASGITLHDGMTGNYCAATFGSLGDVIEINGTEYTIVDRMGGNSGYRVDIFVGEGHARCMELGRYKAEVEL